MQSGRRSLRCSCDLLRNKGGDFASDVVKSVSVCQLRLSESGGDGDGRPANSHRVIHRKLRRALADLGLRESVQNHPETTGMSRGVGHVITFSQEKQESFKQTK